LKARKHVSLRLSKTDGRIEKLFRKFGERIQNMGAIWTIAAFGDDYQSILGSLYFDTNLIKISMPDRCSLSQNENLNSPFFMPELT
jgi:hypothetical protein